MLNRKEKRNEKGGKKLGGCGREITFNSLKQGVPMSKSKTEKKIEFINIKGILCGDLSCSK